MARQIHYSPQLAAHAPGMPPAPRLEAADPDDSGSRIARHLDDFMRVAGPALGRAYMAQETARVDDAVMAAENRMAQWQADYQAKNQGALAVNAAADYAKAWEEISAQTAKDFDGKGHTVFPEMLAGRLKDIGNHALKTGIGYAARQTELWRASQLESQIDRLRRFAAANPFSPDVAREAQAVKDSAALKNPGLDQGSFQRRIDEEVLLAPIERLLSEGRGHEAEALLNQARSRTVARADIKGMDPQVEALVREAAAKEGFDEAGAERLLAQCMQESSGRQNVVSRAGAIGAMQIMPGTAKELGIDPRDVRQNVAGGVRLMKKLIKDFGGSWEDAWAAYNMGAGGLAQVKAGKRTMPQETREYARRIMARLNQSQIAGLSEARAASIAGRIEAMKRQELAARRGRMELEIRNFTAKSLDGHILDKPYTDAQVAAVFGEDAERALASMNGAASVALDIDAASRMSVAAQNELLASRQPKPDSPAYAQDSQAYAILASRVAAMQKQMLQDPAAFAAAHDDACCNARETFFKNPGADSGLAYVSAMRQFCKERGLPPRLLSQADADSLGAAIAQSKEPVAQLKAMAAAFGPAWAQASRELAPALSPTLRIIAAGGMPEESARWLIRAERDKDFEKKEETLLGRDGSDRNTLIGKAHDLLEDLQGTFMAGGNSETPLAMERALYRLTLCHMARSGIKSGEALKRAYKDLVDDKWEIMKFNNRNTVRVPRQYNGEALDMDAIQAGLAAWLDNPPTGLIAAEGQAYHSEGLTQQALASMLRANGWWLTDPEEGGAILMFGNAPVRGTGGNPVRRSWRELSELGSQEFRRRQEAEEVAASSGLADMASGEARAPENVTVK